MSKSISMYSYSVPVLVHSLKSLDAILAKASAWAQEKKIDETVLTGSRLFPDMFPLAKQVQIASDVSKACGARLAGVENPAYADTETTIAELQARIGKTVAFLEGLRAEQLDGSETRHVSFKAGPTELTFTGMDYLKEWVYPNFYFHVTTAYNILRHNGLVIGKLDFLGIKPQG